MAGFNKLFARITKLQKYSANENFHELQMRFLLEKLSRGTNKPSFPTYGRKPPHSRERKREREREREVYAHVKQLKFLPRAKCI